MKRSTENNQSKNKKQKSFDENQELGIIDSICLRNFMCHDHLKFDFDSHVNFIIGQNGSGKSAILTGIILALGGKSSATGRYPNIKGFIKTGKQKAFLSVTLKNCGYCAYKPDLYGERIIVEREISVDGSSSYKLKSEEGKLISNLKEELNNIINAMDIQIENPVVVLTQETSRNFLMSKQGREEKFYEFFYKGTGIQQLEDNYFLNELKAKEQLLNEKVERKNELERILSNALNKSESCKKVYGVECAKLAQYNKEKTECDTERKTQMKILEDLREKQNSCNENLRKAQGMLSRYKRKEEKLREDIAILQNSVQENNDRNQNDIYEEGKKRNRRIQELEQLNNNAIAKQNAIDDKRKHLLQEQTSTQESKDKIHQEINHFNYQKTALQNTLKQLVSAKEDRHVLFGEHTSAVLNEIALRSQEFIEIPKGPIGLYLEVKDPKWNNAVEACLKRGVLCSYCCDNSQDSQLLIQILRKHCDLNIPSVIVSKFLPQMRNVSTQKAQSNFPTVLDMLNIKDPVVANCLIDQINIENIILVEDIKTAQSIMLDNTPPKNCKSAFLLNCDEILLNPYRHYASYIKPDNLLQTVNESRIRAVEQKCKSIEQKIQDLRQQFGNMITLLKSYPVKFENLDKEYVHLRSLMKQNSRQIEDLKQYEEPKDVSGMQDELAGYQNELKRKQLDINKCTEEVTKGQAEFEELTNRIITQRKLVEKEKAKFNDLLEKIKACVERKEQFASSKREYDTKAKDTEVQLNMIKVELKKDREKFQMIVEAANKFGEPIETDRSVEEITIQITETEKVIRQQSKCDREELLENFKDKFKKLQQAKKDLKTRKQYCSKIDSMLRMRKRKLAEFIKHTQHCLDLAFAVVLKSNGFTGRLDFSKPGCLKLEATRHEKPGAGGQKKTSSLSGGERSFVTVAFLLAVWDRIKTPFRILDEYDVFMDSNFRDLCINLLIKRAEFMKNTQFIFLSPLELPNFKASDNIKVHKMPAPKRMGLSNVENMEE